MADGKRHIAPVIWRRAAKTLGAALLLLLAALALGLTWLETDSGRRQLVAWLNERLDSADGRVRLGPIKGSLFSDFTVENILFSDRDGRWLEIHGAHVNWSPLSLLKRRLEISEMAVEKLRLIRTPLPSPNRTEAPGDTVRLPGLPLDLEIAAFQGENLLIGKKIVGIQARFSGSGALKLTRSDGVFFAATLINTGKDKDEITARIAYPGAGGDLSVNMVIRAPAGGLMTRLAGMDPRYDALATVEGAGPPENWTGQFRMRVGETTIADATLRRTGRAFAVRGRLNAGQFIAERDAALWGRTASLALDLRPGDSRDRTELSLELVAETLRLTAQGAVAADDIGSSDKVAFAVEVTDTGPLNRMFAPLDLRPFRLDGALSDLTRAARLTATTSRLQVGYGAEIAGEFSGRFEARTEDGRTVFSTTGRMDQLTGQAIGDISALTAPGFSWAINGRADLAQMSFALERIAVTNDRLRATGHGQYVAATGALSGKLAASLTDISALVADLAGRLDMTADITRPTAAAPLQAQVTATAAGLDLGDETANDLIGAAPRLTALIRRTHDGTLALEQARLDAPHLKLSARGQISPEQVIRQAVFDLSLSDLASIKKIEDLNFDGGIDIRGTLSGPLASPDMTVESGINRLTIQDISLDKVAVRATAENILTRPRGAITLAGQSNIGPLTGAADFAVRPNSRYRFSAIDLALGPYRTTGDIQGAAGKPLAGRLTLRTEENSAGMGGGFSAVLAAELLLADQAGRQQITATGHLTDLALPIDFSAGEKAMLTVKSATFSADAQLTGASPDVQFTAAVTQLSHPRIQAAAGQLSVNQDSGGIAFDLQARGTEIMPYDLTFSGHSPPPAQQTRQVTLTLDGVIDKTPVRLADPLVFSLSPAGYELAPFTLQLGAGQLKGALKMHKNDISASITADKADLRPLVMIAPEIPLAGLLSGKLDLAATPRATDGAFAFDLAALRLASDATPLSQKLMLSTTGTITAQDIAFTTSVRLDNLRKARLTARLPLRINLMTPGVRLADDRPLSGEMTWTGELGPVWPVFDLASHELGGEIDTKLVLGGTLANPDIDGHLRLTKGRYEALKIGFVATDIDLAATVVDRRLVLDHLTARDGAAGRISAKGEITLKLDDGYEAKVDLEVAKAHLIRQPEIDVLASADLTFLKTSSQSYLKGEVRVDKADIGAVTRGRPAIPQLEVREINLPERKPQAEKTAAGHLGPFPLAIKFKVPGKLFIRSYGMDSEWRADLAVTGTTDRPVVAGTASLIRGIFDFAGKRFTLSRGALRFPGDDSNDPQLDISAEHKLSDLTAVLAISGRASAPTLKVTSTPALPQDEILSRILFGTSVTELSALEALQLAAAVHSLSNGGGPGLIGGVRNALGIDRLTIDRADEGHDFGTTITGGKYLTNNIYVEVTTAPATGETATSVEVSLSRSLSLVTRQAEGQGKNLAIRWSRKY